MPNDDYETIRNEERGCGHLDHGKGYVRSPPKGKGGVLPSFVRFDPPIPYLERSKFRGYEYFPGISFELAVTGVADVPTTHAEWAVPAGKEDPRLDDEDEDMKEILFEENLFLQDAISNVSAKIGDTLPNGEVSTTPPGEVWRHIARTTGSAEGDHAGDMVAFSAHDLYMHVGASYYPDPEDFIQEVREQGLSKAIPVSQSQEPPVINPGSTRLFLVHPAACGEENDTAGVIGYVYLSRTIYTEDVEGRFPAWAKKQARSRDDMDLVHIGDEIYEDGTRATTVEEVDEFGNGEDDEGDEEAVVSHGDVEEGEDARDLGEQVLDAVGDTLEPSVAESPKETEGPDAKILSVTHPDECPECGTATEEEAMEGGGTVTFCPSCGWDNATAVNAAWVEHDLRQMEYNQLRSKASDELDAPPANPSYEELIRAFLREWGLT